MCLSFQRSTYSSCKLIFYCLGFHVLQSLPIVNEVQCFFFRLAEVHSSCTHGHLKIKGSSWVINSHGGGRGTGRKMSYYVSFVLFINSSRVHVD
jgi:hypothetical protein